MKKILVFILLSGLISSCQDRERKWMIIVDTGMGRPNDTVYTTGDHLENYGYHEVSVYRSRGFNSCFHPDEVYNDVKFVKEITK